MIRAGLAVVLFTALLPACARRDKDPALVAYDRFVASIRAGRADLVWEGLTPSARAELAERLGLAADVDGEAAARLLAARPGWQFELDLPGRGRLDRAEYGDARRVVVGPLAGRTWRVVVVAVDEAWKIDLFESVPADEPGGA